jgi:hypothetical protein
MESADDLAGLRITDEHGERAKVVVSSLVHIIGPETIADHCCVGGIELIGHSDLCLCVDITVRHIRLPSTVLAAMPARAIDIEIDI